MLRNIRDETREYGSKYKSILSEELHEKVNGGNSEPGANVHEFLAIDKIYWLKRCSSEALKSCTFEDKPMSTAISQLGIS
jgi:hypothetical protein